MKKLISTTLLGMIILTGNPIMASEDKVEEFKPIMVALPPPPPATYGVDGEPFTIRYQIPPHTSYNGYGAMDVYPDMGSTHTPSAPPAACIDELNLRYQTARMYIIGQGATQDVPKAMSMLEECIQAGHARAHFTLGVIQLDGIGGIPINHNEAFRLFNLGVALNDSSCMNALASMHIQGLVGQKDPARAFELFTLASNMGLVDAKFNLGKMLYSGDGVPKNKKLARRFIHEAAELGHVQANQVLRKACCLIWLPL